jgi:hypothetical protein
MDVPVRGVVGETTSVAPAISYTRFGGVCMLLAGVTGFLYSVSFVIIDRISSRVADKTSAIFLLLGGLLASVALVALYERLRRLEADPGFTLWALLLGIVSALGSAVHGGYDLANAIHAPATNPDLPSGVDPRGLLTFGLAGLATFTFAWLIRHTTAFPYRLGTLGMTLGLFLLIIYLGRMIVLNAHNPLIVIPAVLAGFVMTPAWYFWLGTWLLKQDAEDRMVKTDGSRTW